MFFPFSDSNVFLNHILLSCHILSHFVSHLSHFVTFCHILNHILSSSDPSPAFCDNATEPCPRSSFTPFLLVSWYCCPQTQIYLIMSMLMGHKLACLLRAIFILSKERSGVAFLTGLTDIYISIQAITNTWLMLVFSIAVLFGLFLREKAWKVGFPVSSSAGSCKSFCMPSFKDVVFVTMNS